MAYLTFKRLSLGADDDDEDNEKGEAERLAAYKRKARILPQFHRRPDTTFHPCVSDQGYRQGPLTCTASIIKLQLMVSFWNFISKNQSVRMRASSQLEKEAEEAEGILRTTVG